MTRRPSKSGGTLEALVKQARNAVFKQLADAAPHFGITLHKNIPGRLVTSDAATLAVTAISGYDPAKLDEGTNAMFIYFDGGRSRNTSSVRRGFYVLRAFSGRNKEKPYGLLLDKRGKTVAKLNAVMELKIGGPTLGVSGSMFPSGSGSVTVCADIELNGQVYTVCISVQSPKD
jgi:hypothetical protein